LLDKPEAFANPAEDLELCYLARLTPRATEDGRVIGGDAAFVYASEKFLKFRDWPSYARDCANNAVNAAFALAEQGMTLPARQTKLAIFTAENWTQAKPYLLVNDQILITWELGDDRDSIVIRPEDALAEPMIALIRAGEASQRQIGGQT
jgi:hypothetical protein